MAIVPLGATDSITLFCVLDWMLQIRTVELNSIEKKKKKRKNDTIPYNILVRN